MAQDKKTGTYLYDSTGTQTERTVKDMPNQEKTQPQKQ